MNLTIHKYIEGTANEPLAGVAFKITDGSGTPVGPGDGVFYTNTEAVCGRVRQHRRHPQLFERSGELHPDQMVRMMLSGTEVAVRLSGSALKNLLALTLALAQNHKTLSGKVNMGKMLRETRDLRRFPMTPERYKQFKNLRLPTPSEYDNLSDVTVR